MSFSLLTQGVDSGLRIRPEPGLSPGYSVPFPAGSYTFPAGTGRKYTRNSVAVFRAGTPPYRKSSKYCRIRRPETAGNQNVSQRNPSVSHGNYKGIHRDPDRK